MNRMLRFCAPWLLTGVALCAGQARVRTKLADGGVPASSAFNIPQVTRLDDRTMQVGANCTSQLPCLFTDTYTTYAVTGGCTFRLIGSDALAVNFVLDSYGFVALTNVGGEASVAGDCPVGPDSPQSLPSLTDPGSILLARFTVASGTWNATPDMTAALLRTWTFQSDTLALTKSLSAVKIDLPPGLQSNALRLLTDRTPKKGESCFPGTWSMDDVFLYRCAGPDPTQATGRWRVVPFTDW